MVDPNHALEFMNKEMEKLSREYTIFQEQSKIQETRQQLTQLTTMKESISSRVNTFYQDPTIFTALPSPADSSFNYTPQNSKPIDTYNDPRQSMNNKLDSYYNVVPTYQRKQPITPVNQPTNSPPQQYDPHNTIIEQGNADITGMRIPKRCNPYDSSSDISQNKLNALIPMGRAMHAPPSTQSQLPQATMSRNNYKDDANSRLTHLTPIPNTAPISRLLNPNAKPV
jgi:hypothetical protein